MTACVRRAHTVWTSCECPPCTVDRNRLVKLHRNGKFWRVSSDDAWRSLIVLIDQEWSPHAIASAANLSPRYISGLVIEYRRGRRPKIGPRRAAALVNIKGESTRGRIPVTGARRRLQALSAVGHSMSGLAAAYDIHRSTLNVIRAGHTQQISTVHHRLIARMYVELCMTHGGDKRTATTAAARGWAPPLAWDDIDTDEAPTGLIHHGIKAQQVDRRALRDDPIVAARIIAGDYTGPLGQALGQAQREVVVRHFAAQGLSDREIGRRLGVSDHTIAWHRRNLGIPSRWAA